MIPLPPPVAGVPFDVETAAGLVAAYELGEGRTVLLLHSFNAAGSGIELAPLATRLAEHRRVVLVDWIGFGTSDRPDAPYSSDFYGDQARARSTSSRSRFPASTSSSPPPSIPNGSAGSS